MSLLKVKKLREDAQLPSRATQGSAGYDLYACLDREITVAAGETVKIPTGIAIELESSGFAAFVFARSSMGTKHSVIPANAVGVIDSDYRGEVCVFLKNYSQTDYMVQPQDRVAQLIILPVELPQLEEVDELSDTQRGDGGFGSSGK